MLIEKILLAQQADSDSMLSLIQQFMPLFHKYSFKLKSEDAKEDLIADFIEFIDAFQVSALKNTGDGAIVNYISKTVYRCYLNRLKYSFDHDAYCISFEELEENQRRRIPDLVTEDMYFLELDLPAFLLTKKEMIVLSNIYLNQYSVSKIATMLNTTRQNVNQIKKHAEAKLKSYYNANNR